MTETTMPHWLTIPPVPHGVAIAGEVRASPTGKAVAGALVQISAAPPAFNSWLALQQKLHGAGWATMAERPDRRLTTADGFFWFMDLPDGPYTLVATLPGQGTRYGTASAQVTVHAGQMTTTTLALPATTLKGRITAQTSGDGLFLAQVRLQGSGEMTFSDRQGYYRLTGLETGARLVLVMVKGYVQPAPSAVVLDPAGVERTLDVALARATP